MKPELIPWPESVSEGQRPTALRLEQAPYDDPLTVEVYPQKLIRRHRITGEAVAPVNAYPDDLPVLPAIEMPPFRVDMNQDGSRGVMYLEIEQVVRATDEGDANADVGMPVGTDICVPPGLRQFTYTHR